MPETAVIHTTSQKMAEAAYKRVLDRKEDPKFASFARSFPSLIHSCGLDQAVAFARSKKHEKYLDDLAEVLKLAGHPNVATADSLEATARTAPVAAYLRLSRNALQAAGWLKRYVEAVAPPGEE